MEQGLALTCALERALLQKHVYKIRARSGASPSKNPFSTFCAGSN